MFQAKQSSEQRFGNDIEYKVILLKELSKVFRNMSSDFCQAIAAVVQLYFIFNIFYPPEADDLCQFLQRILCNFMDGDGARNSKGVVKKCFP